MVLLRQAQRNNTTPLHRTITHRLTEINRTNRPNKAPVHSNTPRLLANHPMVRATDNLMVAILTAHNLHRVVSLASTTKDSSRTMERPRQVVMLLLRGSIPLLADTAVNSILVDSPGRHSTVANRHTANTRLLLRATGHHIRV